MNKASAFTFYFMYFAALAALMPFLVLYYQQLGFSGAQIGLLTALSPLISLVGAPLWTGLADATRRHRLVLSLAILGALLLALVFPWFKAFGAVALIVGLFSFCIAPIVPLSDSATMAMLAGEKASYGRVRLGGTLGWGIAAPLVGMLVQAYGLKLAFWSYSAVMAVALLVGQRFVFGLSVAGVSIRAGLRMLMANRRWVLFMALAFVGGIGFAAINIYLFAYLEELKADPTMMGIALTIATLSELPVLFFANRLLRRLKAHGLLLLSLGVTGLRMLLYAAFNFPLGVLLVQITNGLTFPAAWVAGVSYADENAPAGLGATSQGLFGAMVMGIGSAAGGFFGGLLLGSIGARGMYLVLGVAVLLGLGLISLIEQRAAK